MYPSHVSEISESIQRFEEYTPRVVADLQNVTFEIRHIREDVAGRYSDGDLEDAYRLVMANQVSGEEFNQIIGEGRFDAQTLFFDTIIVFLFPSERYQGVFASFDYSEEFPVTEL
jgi:hypothetical protein